MRPHIGPFGETLERRPEPPAAALERRMTGRGRR